MGLACSRHGPLGTDGTVQKWGRNSGSRERGYLTSDCTTCGGCGLVGCCAITPTQLGRSSGRCVINCVEEPRVQVAERSQLMTPSAKTEPHEVLIEPRRQLMALSFGISSAVLCLLAMSTEVACVNFTKKQATIPNSCNIYPQNVETLSKEPLSRTRLLSFCSQQCSDKAFEVFSSILTLGLILQALSVIPWICSCGRNFLLVTWRVNFTGDVAEFRELTETSNGNWLWRRIQAWTGEKRGDLFDWLNRIVQKHSRKLPVPASAVSSLSNLLLLVSAVLLVIIMFSSFPFFGVTFECTAHNASQLAVKADPAHNWYGVVCLIFGCFLLCWDVYLQNLAVWMYHCEEDVAVIREHVFQRGNRGCNAGMPQTRAPDGGDTQVDCARRLVVPLNDHPVLKPLTGFELLKVSRGGHDLQLHDCTGWGGDQQILDCYFAPYLERPSGRQRRRGWVLIFAALGWVMLYTGSNACWACVTGVKLGKDGSLFDVESQVLLLGSCGRHGGTGVPSKVACFALALLLVAQGIVSLAVHRQTTGGNESDHLAITLIDMREYQENLLNQVLADQEVRSHVWVQPVDSGTDSWQVADFSEQDRRHWRRSEGLVSGVRIVQEPERKGHQTNWMHIDETNLPEDEGPPSVHIEFIGSGGSEDEPRRIRQLVPVDFLPGSFFCSVNVGRLRAWTMLSIILAIVALFLVALDLCLHAHYKFRGRLLSGCEDVLTGRCLELEPGDVVTFSTTVGAYLASLGGLFVVLDICLLCCT